MESKREQEAVVRAACGGATVLTGNTRATRFLLAACDAILGRSAQAWKTPDILPISSWVQRSFREAQVAGASDLVLLNHRQSNSLWRQCIVESAGLAELMRPSSASQQAAQAWTLVHAYRIPLDPSFDSTTQSKAFLGWAKRYQQLLARRNWTDTARVADELAKAAEKMGRLLPQEIHIWGCEEQTPQRAELLAAMQRAGVPVTEHIFGEAGWAHTRKMACDDSSAELQRAATFSRDLLRKEPATRIGIVVPRLREQRAAAESTFMEILHPEFYAGVEGARVFEISLGDSLAGYPLVKTALTLLRFTVDELSFQEVKELFGSPYIAGAPSENGERARLCLWMGEYGPEQMSAQRLLRLLNVPEHGDQAAKHLAEISVPRLRRVVSQIARPEGLPVKAAMSDWATRLGRWLGTLGWPGEEDRKLDSRNFQAYKKWLELLSELASLDVTQGPMELREAVDEIARAAAAQTFAPENTGAPVQIMDEGEAEGSLFDHLWVCGLEDETWPPRPGISPFIPVRLQQAALVPGSSPESQAEVARKKMARLLASSPEVLLSYLLRDGERELRVSPGIETAKQVAWEELGIAAEPTWLDRLRDAELEEFEDEKAPPLTDAELLHRGTTLLKLQSECPFRAFADQRLSATKAEEPAAGIKPTTRGNLVESVLQIFWEGARDLDNLRGLPADERERLITSAVDKAIQEMPCAAQTPAEKRLREIERERLVALTREWLEVEYDRKQFDHVRHQQEFDYTVSGVRLHGRIDRIDRSVTQPGEVVIDYKASANPKNKSKSWETPRPLLPQLPLYAAYLQSQGKTVAGVAFGAVSTGECGVSGMAIGDEVFGKRMAPRWTKLTLREQIEEWSREIERLVAAHMAGEAAVDPKIPPSRSGSTCKYCHLHAMCRVAESVVIDGDDEESDDE